MSRKKLFLTCSAVTSGLTTYDDGTKVPFASVQNQTVLNFTSTDTPLPNYELLIAQGKDASTNFQRYSRVKYRKGVVTSQIRNQLSPPSVSYTTRYSKELLPPLVKVYSGTAKSEALAIANSVFRGKLSQSANDFKSLMPLAEIRETRHLLRDITQSITKDLKVLASATAAFKGAVQGYHPTSKRVKAAADTLAKRGADTWLGIGFGIAPTMSDVSQLTSAIIRKLEDSGDRNHVIRAYKSFEVSESTTGVLETVNNVGGLPRSQYHHFCKAGYVGAVNLSLTNSADYTGMEHFGVSKLSEIVPAVWEATSYSWLIDYFANVNEFLEDNFSVLPGTLIYLDEIYKQTTISSLSYDNFKAYGLPGTAKPFHLHQSASTLHYEYKTRTKLASLPTRSLRIRSSDEVLHHALTKLTNIASVIYPRISRR